MMEGRSDVLRLQIGIFPQNSSDCITSFFEAPNGGSRNSRSADYPSIAIDMARALHCANFLGIASVEIVNVFLCIGYDRLEEYAPNHILAANDFARQPGPWFVKYDPSFQHVQRGMGPTIIGKMTELLSDLPKMLKGHPMRVPQYAKHTEADKVLERIEPTVDETPIVVGILRLEKARSVPVAQLRFGQTGKPLNLFFTKSGYDFAGS
jgi:hypothetical protein